MTIPETPFVIEVQPLVDNQKPVKTRVEPDHAELTGGSGTYKWVHGYIIFKSVESKTKAGYLFFNQFEYMLETKQYTILYTI